MSILYPFFATLVVLTFWTGTGFSAPLETPNQSEDFAKSATWRRFLQYQSRGDLYQSRVTNPDFFLSPKGRNDPRAELDADLASFQRILPSGENHPQCLFPGRYFLLRHYFTLAPPVHCYQFENWLSEYKPKKISYVYASQYVSNPTSVFGHSFLLLSSDQVNEYFWATFNYAADIPPDTGRIAYVAKGIFGGFVGSFEVIPYYQRLHIYNNMENRDLWIYELNLSETEVALLTRYLWELAERAKIPYYFISQNCSGVLLATLEAIRPEFSGLDKFSMYVVPSEVSKVLFEGHLVAKVRRMPALNGVLQGKLAGLTRAQLKKFSVVIKTYRIDEDDRKDAELLDALMDYLGVVYSKRHGDLDEPNLALKKQVYIARAALGILPDRPNDKLSGSPPHESHDTRRAGLGWLHRTDFNVLGITYRPALHGFMDWGAGYLPHSEIELLDWSATVGKMGLRFEGVTLAAIRGFRPITSMENPPSWQINIGIRRNPFFPDLEHYEFQTDGAFGISSEFGSGHWTPYFMVGTRWTEGAKFPEAPLSAGPLAGQILDGGRFRLHSNLGYYYPIYQPEKNEEFFYSNELRIHIQRNFEIHLRQRWAQMPHRKDRVEEYAVQLAYFL